jgi:predicted Fe-Mo cluster-binding NifX family protein
MKIAVPASQNNYKSLISNYLGRSPFITIYDEETKEYQFIENVGFKTQDGSGLKATKIIIQNKANVLLTMEIGQKAYSVLMKDHVDVHLINSRSTIKSIIQNFLKKSEV